MRLIIISMLLSCIVAVVAIPVNNFADIELSGRTSRFDSLANRGNLVDRRRDGRLWPDRSYRSKSEEKCEEYAREIVWILPLGKSRPIPISIDCTVPMNPLISGGAFAETGEFPHMAAIGWLLQEKTIGYYCGGSLVSDRWVLTAAHCTHHGTMGKPFVVRVGANRLSDESSGQSVTIERAERHPAYKPPVMYADLGLVKLSMAVRFTPNVKPACLHSQFNESPRQAWITGWGSKQRDDEPSDVLLKARLDIVDNVRCSLLYNFTTSVPSGVVPSMLCAGDPNGGWKRDTCQGDSGGPLQVIRPNRCIYDIIGVTSFGRLCATPDFPGVYTRVSHYLEWIESIVWPEDY